MPQFFMKGENGIMFRMELLAQSPNEFTFSGIRNTSGLRKREISTGYTREIASKMLPFFFQK